MLACEKCSNQQEVGKFCGKCGGTLVAVDETPVNEEVNPVEQETPRVEQVVQEPVVQQQVANQEVAVTTQETTAPANDTIENLKGSASAYFEYFKQTLKNPKISFSQGESEVKNALISIVLFALFFGISTFTSVSAMSIFDTPFFEVFGGGVIVVLLSIALVVSVLFLINKLFGSDSSFKTMVTIYGGHLSLALIVIATALILVLIKSFGFGTTLTMTSLLLIISVQPLYIISSLLTKASKGIDAFYGYLIYIVLIIIGVTIIISVLADSVLGNFLNNFPF